MEAIRVGKQQIPTRLANRDDPLRLLGNSAKVLSSLLRVSVQ